MRKNKRVLVTGSSGFLGSYVVDNLIDNGYEVIGIDLRKSKYEQRLTEFHCCDILDYESIQYILKDCNYVYHLAGIADIRESVENPEKTIKGNIIGTQNILKACV